MPSALSKITRTVQKQCTLKISVQIEGRGVHTGQPCRVVISPSESNSGFCFRRQGVKIPALAKYITKTSGAMTLTHEKISILTTEHLLAALVGLGYHHANIDVSGPELPILDGSSLPWVRLLRKAGIKESHLPVLTWKLNQTLVFRNQHSFARLTPSEQTIISCHISLGQQTQFAEFNLQKNLFETQIAPARTYVQQSIINQMIAKGLLKGAEITSGILLDQHKPINTDFRLPNECARHKILDALGDFALLGAPFVARIELWNNTHDFHGKLIDKISRLL